MTTGFGRDLSTAGGRLMTGRMVSGRRLLAESNINRLNTPRGTLYGGEEEAAYGMDVAGYLGAVGTEVAIHALPALIESELLKDDRNESIEVTATIVTPPSKQVRLYLQITVVPADELGSFDLTLAVTDVGVDNIGELPS